ncbi:MAG: hypothetical protein GEU90_13435 [Gemmatimonas sp.]|nr:hypothetical protein [Gemmatimonas sp.]
MILCSALLAGCVRDPPPDLASPGISLELARHRAATVADLRYEIDLSVPEERLEPLIGTVTLRFRWNDPARLPFVVDMQEPQDRIDEVEVNGELVPDLEYRNNHVVISADLLRTDDENEVVIRMRAGDGPLNRQESFLYTLFVPDRAHHALPVLDQPDLKARVSLSLEIPAGWEAVANGRRVADEELGQGRRRLVFAETQPISTYLIAFAVGAWQRIEGEVAGRSITLYHRETDADRVAANVDRIFELHGTALEWLETYTDIPYPFDDFEIVAVPSFQYSGMEHPGAIYYRAASLFLEPSATQAQLLGRASVIAHETTHMWFGDLVTMRWFDDVWTKEVFANFYAAKIVNPAFPDLEHDLRFFLAHHPAAYGVDRSRGANPIRQPLDNLAEAGSLYGPIIYQKAPIVMRQLERLLGEGRFQEGMRRYLERFAFANASWPELIEILDPLAEIDLAAWSRVWVELPGRPVVDVVREAGDEDLRWRLELRDPQGVPAGTTAGEARVWAQTLDPVVGLGGEVLPLAEVDLGPSRVHLAPALAREGPSEWLLPDGGGYGYALFRLDPESREALLEWIPHLEAPLHRASAIFILWDAILEGELPPARLLDRLLERIAGETEEQLLSHLLGILDTTYWLFLSPDDRQAWAPRVEEALVERLRGAERATVKATVFRALRNVALTPEAVGIVRGVWAGERAFPNLTLGEDDRTSTAFALALREVDGWEDVLEGEEALIEDPDRLERFRFLRPSVDADPDVRERFFESLRERENRSREPWVRTGLAHLNHPLRADHGLRFLRPALELLEEIQRTGDIFFPQDWIGATLAGHASPEAVAVVEVFLAARPDYPPRLRQKILQAVDVTERAARVQGGGP